MAYRFFTILWITLLAGCGDKTHPRVEILHANFGLLAEDSNTKTLFVPTKIIPLREGQRFAWVMDLQTNKEMLSVTEQVTLAAPAPWAIWGDPRDEIEISPDRRTFTARRERIPVKGRISGLWSVTADGPPGKASLKITIEGKVERRFDFELKKP
jgi:hypothetical protein